MIIDIHTHTFPKAVADIVVDQIGRQKAGILPFSDGTPDDLLESMKKNGIDYSVNLPVPTNGKQAVKLNRLAVETKEENFERGIINFGGMDPLFDDFKPILKDLAGHGIQGLKIHPAFSGVFIDDIRYKRIIGYASELGLAVLVHAGIELTTFKTNFATVEGILNVVEDVRPETFILAHMGNLGVWDQVEQYLCGAQVWLDTSYSLGPVDLHPQGQVLPCISHKMYPDQFVRIVKKHGADRILFGSDSPWGGQKEELEMIRSLNLPQEDLDKILGENAVRLLHL